MKGFHLLIIVSLISLVSCEKHCVLSHEIVDTKYEIPFFYFQNEIFREIEKVDYNRYELINVNQYEIPYIMEILNTQVAKDENATANIINNLCDYSVQIAGVYDRKEKVKIIYLNFNCGFTDYESINFNDEYIIGFDGNETKFDHVKDGGDCHFQAVINTKTNKLNIIIVNGEA